MQLYVGNKLLIVAETMDEATFHATISNREMLADQPNRAGFHTRGPSGASSWVPKDTFLNEFRSITPDEGKMILKLVFPPGQREPKDEAKAEEAMINQTNQPPDQTERLPEQEQPSDQ